ncbi:MAG: hypothetical protein WCO42_03080 [bacterium]
MKTMKYWMGAVGVAALAMLVPMGCDNGGSGDNGELDAYFKSHPYVSDPRDGGSSVVTLTPASATLSSVGERAVFTFNGGAEPITWDVSDGSKGSISSSGNQGVYTVTTVGVNDVIAYDRNGNAAIAKISGSSGSSTATPLSASASPSQLDVNNGLAVLTAVGGTEPYTWSVLFPTSRGILPDGMTGTTVIYQRTGAGDNAVTVTDSLGATFNIVIKQP